MKKIMIILAVLLLVAACTPAQDMSEEETTSDGSTDDVGGELGEQVEEVNTDDMNVSELDEVDQDLEDFNW